jgi:hypothetical protein
MSGTIIVGQPGGGNGKTTIAVGVATGWEVAGVPRRLASADTTDSGSSKLGKVFRDQVLELGTGAKLADLKADRNLALAHFDALGRTLVEGDFILDLGANMTGPVWEWAVARQVGRILRGRKAPLPILVVPMKAELQSVQGALYFLEHSLQCDEVFPLEARILVLNEVVGDFSRYGSSSDFRRLQELKSRHAVRVIRLKACNSEVWPHLERESYSFLSLAMMTPEQYETAFGMDPFAGSGAHYEFVSWLNETLEEFRRVGLVPQEEAVSAAE